MVLLLLTIDLTEEKGQKKYNAGIKAIKRV